MLILDLRNENTAGNNVEYFMILNTESVSWELGKYISTAPLSRYGHTTTSIGPHMLIFGGWEYSRATNEVIVLRDVNVFK